MQAALSAGVDRAARVGGESFAAADFHTLGQVLGSAARTLGSDLILGGARSDTDGLGALTASVARHMGLLTSRTSSRWSRSTSRRWRWRSPCAAAVASAGWGSACRS